MATFLCTEGPCFAHSLISTGDTWVVSFFGHDEWESLCMSVCVDVPLFLLGTSWNGIVAHGVTVLPC
jgi:hypothetical protein